MNSYHQINVRSRAAKLAEAETVIKGMHSIKKNPITFCIREIKFISGCWSRIVFVGKDAGSGVGRGKIEDTATRLLCSINTTQHLLTLLSQEDY